MSLTLVNCLSRLGRCHHMCNLHRYITTTAAVHAGKKWRLKQGLGSCGNEYGPLVDIPDWSYADGRPAPLGTRELARREKQKAMSERIVEMMSEMQSAKEEYAKNQAEKKAIREKLLKSRLKSKHSR